MKLASTFLALLSLGIPVLALPASHEVAAEHGDGEVIPSKRGAGGYQRLLARRSAAAQGVKRAGLSSGHSSVPVNRVPFGESAGGDAHPASPVLVRDVWDSRHGRGANRLPTSDSASANKTGAVHGAPDDAGAASVSANWAGAVLHVDSGFTGVMGTFSVPVPRASNITHDAHSSKYAGAAWVGIDGDRCQRAILQTGVDWEIDIISGETTFVAWYEYFPKVSFTFEGFEVKGGDDITLRAQVPSDGELDGGLVTITNLRTGKTVSQTFTGESTPLCGMDAEWIVEDFTVCNGSDCGLVNFADFGTVAFSSASATKSSGITRSSTAQSSDTTLSSTTQSGTTQSDTTLSGTTQSGTAEPSFTATNPFTTTNSRTASSPSSPTSPSSQSAPGLGIINGTNTEAQTLATTPPLTAPDAKGEKSRTSGPTVTETVWVTVTAAPKAKAKNAQIQGRQAASDQVVIGVTGAEILAIGVAQGKVVTDCSLVGDDGVTCVYIGG